MEQEFEQAVFQVLASVPPGKVIGYGQVAKQAGYPGYARQVGRLLSRLPAGTNLPWHRVIRSDGALADHASATSEQALRLQQEGIQVQKGRVASSHFVS